MSIKLGKIIEDAYKMKTAEHEANDELKLGNYRAGSTGLYLEGTNELYGQCARKLLLRSKGIKVEEVSDDRKIMFAGGVMNEEIYVEDIKLGSDYNIKQEEEIPTYWKTKTLGTPVTGRPDIVLCDPKTDELLLGLELKMVSSLWTARSVFLENKPKFDHLCQAAHYMWQLDIPFKLVYTSYVDYATSGMAYLFPKYGQPGSELLNYKFYRLGDTYRAKDGRMKRKKHPIREEEFLSLPYSERTSDALKLKPRREIYDLKWSNNGTLLYKREKDLTFERTVVTLKGIEDYFELLDRTQQAEVLPPRPKTTNLEGKAASWSKCDKQYCSLSSVCDSQTDLKSWLEMVKTKSNKGD